MYELLPTYNQGQEIIEILKDIRGNTGMGEVFGIHWNSTTDDVTRIADSVGLTYTKSISGDITTVISDFDSKYPFAGLRRCNYDMVNEKVLYYYGHDNYTDTPALGVEVMVEVPKYYYRTQRVSNGIIWLVSEYKREGFKVHPAFIRDGVEKDKIYVSAYEGAVYDVVNDLYVTGQNATNNGQLLIGSVANGRLRSIKGQQPTSDHTIVECRTFATQNNGEGYDALSHWALSLLMIIEYGTLNTQSVFNGVVNYASGTGNHSQNTGHTDVLGNQSGEVIVLAENGATGQVSQPVFSYRGIENLYGNMWKWLYGMNLSPSGDIGGVYIADNNFVSDKFDEQYTRIGQYPADTPNNYMDDIITNDIIDYGFVPSSTNGSSSTAFADYVFKSTSVNRIALYGGRWTDSAFAGAFNLSLNSSSGDRFLSIASRLLKF
jgi:hypothetical protein